MEKQIVNINIKGRDLIKLLLRKSNCTSYRGLLPNPLLKALPSGMRIMFSQNKNRDVDGLASAIFDSIWAKLSSLTSVKFSPITVLGIFVMSGNLILEL